MSCSVKPEPIHYGRDNCQTCKMTIMDQKFAAELVTKKGKIFKFDDIKCMLGFYLSGYEDEFQYKLIADFARSENWIDCSSAFFIKDESLRTPMGGGIAAFSKRQSVENFLQKNKGVELTWNELITQSK